MALILDGTNGLSDVDGSAATPAIRGSDANTGVFFGSDVVGLSTGGSERVRVGPTGQIGLGGENYGSSGQVLTSGGAGAAPSWQTISTTPTTAQVLTATAGASVGAVGTYASLYKATTGGLSAGNTTAGSGLRYSNAGVNPVGATPSGTWMAMGTIDGDGAVASRNVTTFLRIS